MFTATINNLPIIAKHTEDQVLPSDSQDSCFLRFLALLFFFGGAARQNMVF